MITAGKRYRVKNSEMCVFLKLNDVTVVIFINVLYQERKLELELNKNYNE